MKNNWNLYVAGVGSIDAASDMLTKYVSKLRDLGLKITSVQVTDGTFHPDLHALDTSEVGWTMIAYGSGDLQVARGAFPEFLGEFETAGLRVMQSGIVEGALREIPIPV